MADWTVLDESLKEEWEAEAARLVSDAVDEDIEFELRLPDRAAAKDAVAGNYDLKGAVMWRRRGATRWCGLEEVLPFKGVFIIANERGVRAGAAGWNTYFVPDGSGTCEDIENRRVMTFPLMLLSRLVGKFKEAADSGKDLFAAETWRNVTLVPARSWLASRYPLLKRIAPNNALDLASLVYGVKRYVVPRGKAMGYPPSRRCNHASFDGRLCPVDTPESEMVGIALQFARGATVGVDGRIVPAPAADSPFLSRLGRGAAMIPLAHINDGVRDMMGAKNLRQAVPVVGRAAPAVKTGAEEELLAWAEPLIKAGICPDCRDTSGNFALGRDLLVAYMPWNGWNVDDAIVVSEEIAAEMGVKERKVCSRELEPGWKIERSCLGGRVEAGDEIITFKNPAGKKFSIRYFDPTPARLVSLSITGDGEGVSIVSPRLTYVIEKTIPLGPGDKLMGRHGNKGVVARVLKRDEMPHLPDDPSLPENMRGRAVDVILNPHGVLSRMNPGQLLETHLGWLLHAGFADADVLVDAAGSDRCGAPAKGIVDHKKVRGLLEKTGLDRSGRIRLVLPDRSKTERPVVVGFQHIVRLHHIPELKSQARGNGSDVRYDPVTLQPVRGRRAGGGQRLGEMEVWALAAYGADRVLEEMLGGKSDRDWAGRWREERALPTGRHGGCELGFAHLFSDWLRALCVDLEVTPTGVRFSMLTDRDTAIAKSGGERGRVSSDAGLRIDGRRRNVVEERVEGGLYDPGIFNGKDAWGFIELPEAVSHPFDSGSNIKIVPVLPLHYRPVRKDEELNLLADDFTSLYRGVLVAGRNVEKIKRAVKNLFDVLAEHLKGKNGFLRHEGLGRRVDRSFRLVIAPDPGLEWDQVGVPAGVLWEMMADAVKADEASRDEVPVDAVVTKGGGMSWRRDREERHIASRLRRYLENHPGTLLVLNRQPTLLSSGMQALRPVVKEAAEGEVLSLSPLCCKGFAADFDGDEMTGHYPVSEAAREDARRLLPGNNLFSTATGETLANYDRDFVTGCCLIASEAERYMERLRDAGFDDCCLQILRGASCDPKSFGENILGHVCSEHSDKAVRLVSCLSRTAFEACTVKGISFGFYDLCNASIVASGEGGPVADGSDASLGEIVNSGANGQRQISQICASRGVLETDDGTVDLSGTRLVDGMTWDEFFTASHNARYSMSQKKIGTQKAGALTRKLVVALWPWSVVMDDCGSDARRRSPDTCLAEHGFCSRCYGALAGGARAETGYPAGLVAAQSLGERGTQLSMQVFHAGGGAVDIASVSRLMLKGELDGENLVTSCGNADAFVDKFKSIRQYSKIDERHLRVLWRVLWRVLKKTGGALKADGDVGCAAMAVSDQIGEIVKLARGGKSVGWDSPFVRVLFNGFGTRVQEEVSGE